MPEILMCRSDNDVIHLSVSEVYLIVLLIQVGECFFSLCLSFGSMFALFICFVCN